MRLQLTATRVRHLRLHVAAWFATLVVTACTGPDATVPSWTAPPLDAATPANAAGMTATPNVAGTTGAAGTQAVPVPVPVPTPIEDASMPDAAPIDATVHVDDEDAGPWMPPDLTCADGVWRLAPGFLVSRRVDYVADRIAQPKGTSVGATEKADLISSAGMACANAKNRANCESALALPVPFGRHLVTTSGDEVKVWHSAQGRILLGLIDTKAEALWWLQVVSSYFAPCDVQITIEDGLFVIDGVVHNISCDPTFVDAAVPPAPERSKVSISPEGAMVILRDAPIVFSSGCAPMPGITPVQPTTPPPAF